MKKYFLSALLAILVIFGNAQNRPTSKVKATTTNGQTPDFANEGEQEDWWVKQAFTKSYNHQKFAKYNGAITDSGETFKFGKQVIEVYASKEIKSLFRTGVFYPSLLLFADNGLDRSVKIRLLKDTTQRSRSDDTLPAVKNLKSVFNPDSLAVSAFEELKPLETSPKQRRFRFLLYTKGFLNPTLYFVELTNDQATSATNLAVFLKNARISFLRQGSVLI